MNGRTLTCPNPPTSGTETTAMSGSTISRRRYATILAKKPVRQESCRTGSSRRLYARGTRLSATAPEPTAYKGSGPELVRGIAKGLRSRLSVAGPKAPSSLPANVPSQKKKNAFEQKIETYFDLSLNSLLKHVVETKCFMLVFCYVF